MTATLDAPVTDPLWRGVGVYTAEELSLAEYHADIVPGGSLSSSGARALLDPGCPAQFNHDRQNPQGPKKEFEIGTAAHSLLLGTGSELVVVDAEKWATNAVKAEVLAIRAEDKIPLKPSDMDKVKAMVAAVRAHHQAGPLFAPGGIAEQSLYWADEATGVTCRCRPDMLREYPDLTLCVDYKTAVKADPTSASKAIAERNYHQQDAFYVDGVQAVTGRQARFVLVFQSKTAPYLITVRELSQADRAIGRAKNAKALRIYAECERTGVWPDWTGPVDQIPYISLPPYVAQREAEEFLNV
ncbi:PD-(D/E)XK nuclease-like domain-containing protein [Streptomyces sp. NBC_01476]|uniref:PD-(D/E)XK nuclease-like domain-containing protein n=1 Tax=Streptomyces sp. NBC_01476 TaxID=2903881 RepID=UPI002E300C65|nr:PD-(D/E)XK nuclease-like domain-containing protein [Streptomyces sp. NBC_01476]